MVSVQADIRAYVRRDLGGSGASKGAGGDAINSNSFAPDSKRAKGDLAKDGPIRRSASKNDEVYNSVLYASFPRLPQIYSVMVGAKIFVLL